MFGKQEASKDLEEMAMERAEALLKVLNAASSMDYIGEPISQLEHALQCGKFAADSGTLFFSLGTLGKGVQLRLTQGGPPRC